MSVAEVAAELTGRQIEPMWLSSLHFYPLKAARVIDLEHAVVEPWGLAGDRRWMLVDDTGRFVSQREERTLARLAARPDAVHPAGLRARLTVTVDGRPPLVVPITDGHTEMMKVSVWRSTVVATAAGAEADAWLSDYLQRPVRLVYLDDPTRREVDQDYGAPGDRVSFADGFPLLLTNESSLTELNGWLTDAGDVPLPMNRFRPNVVVSGAPPWGEDGWRRIRIGAVSFRVAKPCSRCVVTTVDQSTAERGTQPLRMLARRRRFDAGLVFGQNLIPDAPGTIRVGDPVTVLEPGPGLVA